MTHLFVNYLQLHLPLFKLHCFLLHPVITNGKGRIMKKFVFNMLSWQQHDDDVIILKKAKALNDSGID